jgi:hypothetical protein
MIGSDYGIGHNVADFPSFEALKRALLVGLPFPWKANLYKYHDA